MIRALGLLLILSGGVGCAIDLSGAPCSNASNCPRGQHCGDGGFCRPGTPPQLERVEIVPGEPVVPRGATRALTAIASYEGGARQDVTGLAVWSSSSHAVATVSDTGVLTGVVEGKAQLTATFDGVVGQTNATVSAPALRQIVLLPKNPSVPKGSAVQLYAEGTYSDQSTVELTSVVSWTSSDQAVARVSNSFGTRGQMVGIAKGSAEIEASYEGLTGKMVVFVEGAILLSVAVTPTQPSIAISTVQQFVATGTYSDKSTGDVSSAASWASSNPTVASISNAAGSKGLASALAQGATTITATQGSISGSTVLVATTATLSSLSVTPTNPARAKGTTEQFSATASFSDGSNQEVTGQVSWASSVVGVATVSNAAGSRGLASTSSAGATMISASLSGISASTQLTVTSATLSSIALSPTNPSIAQGTSTALSATATFSDLSVQDVTGSASWQSSRPAVATVGDGAGSKGVVTGASTGAATISATVSGSSGSTELLVTGATLTGIAVTPSNPTIGKGTTLPFTATGTYSDTTTQDLTSAATWSSANSSVLTISNASGSHGLATAIAPGSATVSATVSPVVGTAALTVTAATLASIAVSPLNPSVAKGSTRQFSAVGSYSDSSTQDLTTQVSWTSSATSVATISNALTSKGLANALTSGGTTIAASFGGLIGSTNMTVTNATLTSIQITPMNPAIPRNAIQQFIATGSYSDGSAQPLTSQVTWSSSDTSVATISNATNSKGRASAVTPGNTTIGATLLTTSAQTSLTVTP